MEAGYTWLKSVADRMKGDVAKGAAPRPEQLTVRELLAKFDYQRRSDWINNHIRNGLERFKLRTDQDVTSAWIDLPITIELDSDAPDASDTPHISDPTHRVSALPAANRPPASVKPESPLREATTIMQMNGYSRLPVMKNERDVSGIVTWESIGTPLALGRLSARSLASAWSRRKRFRGPQDSVRRHSAKSSHGMGTCSYGAQTGRSPVWSRRRT